MVKPLKQCNYPPCRKLIPFDVGYCDTHKREHVKQEQHSRREVNRAYSDKRKQEEPRIHAFYQSKRWERLSRQIKLRDDFMCQECLRNNKYKQANVTDHIIEIKDNWEARWDANNMESLCHYCHNMKTRKEQERRKQENNIS